MSGTNVNEPEHAEKATHASESIFRSMADQAPVLMWRSGLDKGRTWFSQRWLAFVGRGLEQEVGDGWAENVHPEDLESCRADTRAFDAHEPFNIEYRLRRHDGEWRWVLDSGNPLRSSTGDFIGYVGSCLDVTEWRQTANVAEESEARYRTLAESLPHLVWTCLPDGWCDHLSRQWVEYTGVPEDRQLGSGWVEQLHPDDRSRVQAAWAAATGRGDHFDVEFRIRRFDGQYRWFNTRAVPLRDSHGRIIKWFGSNTDFEEYKAAAARRRPCRTGARPIGAGTAH